MLEKTHNATGKSDTDNNNNNKDKTRFFVDISVKKKINQFNSLSFNGAKSFFEQSGILGPIKLKDSLILKTSKIHIDTDLLNQVSSIKNLQTAANNVLFCRYEKSPCAFDHRYVEEKIKKSYNKIMTIYLLIFKMKSVMLKKF